MWRAIFKLECQLLISIYSNSNSESLEKKVDFEKEKKPRLKGGLHVTFGHFYFAT